MLLRAALPSDYPSFARLFPELGAGVAVPPEGRWTAEMVEHGLVAEEGGTVVGYLVAYPLLASGHVSQVVVAPGARGRGVGRALMDAAAAGFRSRGLTRWGLNVRVENEPARRLYAALGMGVVHESVVLRFDAWPRGDALPAAPADVEATGLAPEEDADAEADTGAPAGHLTEARRRSSRVVRVLRRGGRFVGATVFDAELATASPFLVSEPALAGALLAALRAHRRVSHLDLKVDADPALADLLRAAGADVRVRTVHYEGAL